jgi:hypothetical protein
MVSACPDADISNRQSSGTVKNFFMGAVFSGINPDLIYERESGNEKKTGR